MGVSSVITRVKFRKACGSWFWHGCEASSAIMNLGRRYSKAVVSEELKIIDLQLLLPCGHIFCASNNTPLPRHTYIRKKLFTPGYPGV